MMKNDSLGVRACVRKRQRANKNVEATKYFSCNGEKNCSMEASQKALKIIHAYYTLNETKQHQGSLPIAIRSQREKWQNFYRFYLFARVSDFPCCCRRAPMFDFCVHSIDDLLDFFSLCHSLSLTHYLSLSLSVCVSITSKSWYARTIQ